MATEIIFDIYCPATDESFQLSLCRFAPEKLRLARGILHLLAIIFYFLCSRAVCAYMWVEEIRLDGVDDGSTMMSFTFRHRA